MISNKKMDFSNSLRPQNSNIIATLWQGYAGLIVTIAIVISLATAAYSLFAFTPKYTSTASVMIKDSALTAKFLTNDQYSTTTSQSSNPVLNTMELLKSRVLADQIWMDVISKNPEEQKRIKVRTLKKWRAYFGNGKRFLTGKNVPGTDVIALNYTWPNPDIAEESLNSALVGFQLASLRQNQNEHHQRYIYLNQQAEDLKKRLAMLRGNIAEFKKTNNIYSLDSALTSYEQNRSAMQNSSKIAEAEAQNYLSQMQAYKSTLGMNSKKALSAVAIGRNSNLSQLYSDLYTTSQELTSLQSRYTDEHPKVQQLTSQVGQIKKDIQQELARNGIQATAADIAPGKPVPGANGKPSGPPVGGNLSAIGDETRSNAVRDMLEAEAKFKGLQAQSADLKKALADLEGNMKSVPGAEAALENFLQEESSLSASLKVLEEKALEAKMREAQTLSNVFLLDQPTLPYAPQFPNQWQLMVLGVVFGIAGGFTLAYILNALSAPRHNEAYANASAVPLEELIAIEHHKAALEREAAGYKESAYMGKR